MDIKRQYLKTGRYIAISTKGNVIIRDANFINIFITLKVYLRSKFSSKVRYYNHIEQDNELPKFNKIIYRNIDGQILGFDFHNNHLYRVYNDEVQFIQHKSGYTTIDKIFKLNKVEFISNNTTKEKLIKGKLLREASSSKQNEVFKDIVERYNNALRKEKFIYNNPRINTETFFDEIFKRDFPADMLKYIEKEKDNIAETFKNIQWIWSHSDLTPDNIMFDNNEYYIIDTERCEVLPAMYDIVNLILTITMSNNVNPLESYFDGEYDALVRSVISKKYISKTDRKNLVLIMLVLKSILSWDKFVKKNEGYFSRSRWNVFKYKFIE